MQTIQWSQELFDETFIGTSEICSKLKIARSTILLSRKSGRFPEPIKTVNGDFWARAIVKPILEDWEKSLNKRRKIA
jgi:predicted DNA-binding transcriptional regulator AlpA